MRRGEAQRGEAWQARRGRAGQGKVKDVYRRVLYLKHENYDLLVRIKDRLEEYIEINSGFRKVNIQFDFS